MKEENAKKATAKLPGLLAEAVLKATGRKVKYNSSKVENRLQADAVKDKIKMPKIYEQTMTQSIRTYDPNNKYVLNERGIGVLSKEDAQEMAAPPPVTPMKTIRHQVVEQQPMREVWNQNEQMITARSTEAQNPDHIQSMTYFGNAGSANTPNMATGRSFENGGERKQQRYENKLENNFAEGSDDDD